MPGEGRTGRNRAKRKARGKAKAKAKKAKAARTVADWMKGWKRGGG